MIRQPLVPAPPYRRIARSLTVALAAAFCATLMCAQQTAPVNPPAQPAPNSAAHQPAPPTAAGQQPAEPSLDQAPDTVFRIGANEVNLIFTVTDKHGHYIPNLHLQDFALLDDQKAPSRVTSFHQQINLPLRVGLVIDASTSIRTRIQVEQQSAAEFLLHML